MTAILTVTNDQINTTATVYDLGNGRYRDNDANESIAITENTNLQHLINIAEKSRKW
jgi:hypothetical protein